MLSKTVIKRNFLIMKKSIYKNMYGKCHTLNIEGIPFKIKNEARVPSITTSIQLLSYILPSVVRQEKEKKLQRLKKKKQTKWSLFADDIIFCVDNLKEFTGKLFEWMKKLSKFADYKITKSTFP